MATKIKILAVVLALIASFSVYSFWTSLEKSQYRKSPNFSMESPLPNAENDLDQDGLSNQEEVLWGTDPINKDTDGDNYLDGEEVSSGHNPLIPGPDDKLEDENLTKKLSSLALAGLFTGDLKSDSPNYNESLSAVVNSIADSANYIFNPKVSLEELTVIPSTTNVDVSYLKSMASHFNQFNQLVVTQYNQLQPILNTVGQDGFTPSIKKTLEDQTKEYDSLSKQLVNLKVPYDFQNEHLALLSLTRQAKFISEALADGDNDPVRAMTAIKPLISLYNKYLDVILQYQTRATNKNLDSLLN